jgi:hypothetical protein
MIPVGPEKGEFHAEGTNIKAQRICLACWRVAKVASVDQMSRGKAIGRHTREAMGACGLVQHGASCGFFSMLEKPQRVLSRERTYI